MSYINRSNMKTIFNIVIDSTTLNGNQLSAQNSMDNANLPAMTRVTHEYFTCAIPVSQQSHRHVSFQGFYEGN